MKKILLTALIFSVLWSCKKDDPKTESAVKINRIVIDKTGTKWIASDKGIISFYSNTWKTYPLVTNNAIFPVANLGLGNVLGNNQLWMVTPKQGVFSLKLSGVEVLSTENYRAEATKLLSDNVYAVGVDSLDTKYFGTALGLSILKGTTWDKFMGRENEEILSQYPITAIANSSNGWTYVSTNGGGVSRFQYADAVTGATTYNKPWAGLKSDNVFTVVVVNDTCQWYGTDKGAAYHTSSMTKSGWKSYSKSSGLICDSVYTIAQDHAGDTWFGTPSGVSKLSGTTFTNYTTKDGLVNNKVNTIAVDVDGSIWFGTDDGISHFANGSWTTYKNLKFN